MDAFLGLVVAIVAIFLSVYWWSKNSKTPQKSTTETTAASEENEGKVEVLPPPSKKSTQKKKAKPKSTTRSKNKHAIPSDVRFLRRYGGHAGPVTCFAASPDGRWVATAGTDGQIRVAKVDEAGFYLSCTVTTPGLGVFQDHLSALSWLPPATGGDDKGGLPTFVGAIDGSRQVAFYRLRHKKGAANAGANPNGSGQYELIELAKRRFDLSGKVDDNVKVVACLADQSHADSNHCLILTKMEYDSKAKDQLVHPNTVAWSANATGACQAVSAINIHSPNIRLSPDGAFLCGGGEGGTRVPEAKIYEVRWKKVKGESQPVFDSVSSRSVMTLIPKTTAAKIAETCFCGERDNLKTDHDRLGILACDDGTVEVWDLDVDYRQKEDPRFICSARLSFDDAGGEGAPDDGRVVCMAASGAVSPAGDGGGAAPFYRIAVAAADGALHLLSYRAGGAELRADLVIENSHHREGVGELQFCPSSGDVLYSTGKEGSKEVFSWNLS